MKKRIAIIFPDANLPYSPTTLGIFRKLKEKFNVDLYAIHPVQANIPIIQEEGLIYVKKVGLILKLIYSFQYVLLSTLRLIPKLGRYRFKRQQNIYQKLKPNLKNYDILIAVDADTYWRYASTHPCCIFLSLEIIEDDVLVNYLRKNAPKACIIQSNIRYEYYFPNRETPLLLLPNSPSFQEYDKHSIGVKKGLIYSGAAIDYFGFKYCLAFLAKYSEYTLTVKGSIDAKNESLIENEYKELIKKNQLIIESRYLPSDELVPYTNKFRIGFCFYDYHIPFVNTFNYQTAPSGKLFTYLAAGVPVICSNQIGLRFVEEQHCGVCINDFEPDTIKAAIDSIESNYDAYVANTYKVFEANSFDKKANELSAFLSQL